MGGEGGEGSSRPWLGLEAIPQELGHPRSREGGRCRDAVKRRGRVEEKVDGC